MTMSNYMLSICIFCFLSFPAKINDTGLDDDDDDQITFDDFDGDADEIDDVSALCSLILQVFVK